MSTHGDLLFIDHGSEKGIWLHAYSDGHADDAFQHLVTMPEFFVERALLSKKLDDPSLGKGWFFDQWSEKHWRDHFSMCCESYASFLSSMMVNRVFGRWLPCFEEHAPWHDVGEEPDFKIVCFQDHYIIHPSKEVIVCDESVSVKEIDFLGRVFELINKVVENNVKDAEQRHDSIEVSCED